MKRLAIVAGVAVALAVSPAALAAGTLTGKYNTKAEGATFTLIFTKGGRLTIARNGKTFKQTKYRVKATTFTVYPTPHNPKCHTPGTYRFKLTGKTLRFTRIHDVCAARAGGFAGVFTKVG